MTSPFENTQYPFLDLTFENRGKYVVELDSDLRKQDADLRKQEADMRKYTQFLEILENTNLPEDLRNKLEAYCSKYEETM
jgi:hypothetical protein